MIGTDGGLLAAPARAEQAFLATAERLDLLIDLRDARVGDTVLLETLAFDPMHAEVAMAASPAAGHAGTHAAKPAPADEGKHAAHHAGSGWPEGAPRSLLELRVRERVAYDRQVPASLSKLESIEVSGARERPLRLGFNKGRWHLAESSTSASKCRQGFWREFPAGNRRPNTQSSSTLPTVNSKCSG